MPRFKHVSLRDPLTQIRLLKLQPYEEFRDIRCSLQTYDLADAPPYTALSYECGPPEPTVNIFVDGLWFGVRHNLWLFLSQLKEKQHRQTAFDDTLIWADAICISQSDITERDAQVGNMGSIFRKATFTYAWLGWPQGVDAASTFRFLSAKARLELSWKDDPEVWRQKSADYAMKHSEMLANVVALCRLTYFGRRWVLQELLRSREVVLIWGVSELPWDFFLTFLDDIVPPPNLRPPKGFATRPSVLQDIGASLPAEIANYVRCHGRRGAFQRVPLLKILCDFEYSDCETAIDRIYSLLSLSEEHTRLRVDYSLSTSALLCKILTTVAWSQIHDVRVVVNALKMRATDLTSPDACPQSDAKEISTLQKHPTDLSTNTVVKIRTTVRHVFDLPGTLYMAHRGNLTPEARRADRQSTVARLESIFGTNAAVLQVWFYATASAFRCECLEDLWFCLVAVARSCRITSMHGPLAQKGDCSGIAIDPSQKRGSTLFTTHSSHWTTWNYVPGRDDARILVCDAGRIAVCRCPSMPGDILCESEIGPIWVLRDDASSTTSQLVGEARMVFEGAEGIAVEGIGTKESRSTPSCLPPELHDYWTRYRRRETGSLHIPKEWDTHLRRRPRGLKHGTVWEYYTQRPTYGFCLDGHLILRQVFQCASQLEGMASPCNEREGDMLAAQVNIWDYVVSRGEKIKYPDLQGFPQDVLQDESSAEIHEHRRNCRRHSPEDAKIDPLRQLLQLDNPIYNLGDDQGLVPWGDLLERPGP